MLHYRTHCLLVQTLFPNRRSSRRAAGIISSAGGIAALFELFAALPADIPYPLFVTQHFSPDTTSVLAELLRRRCSLDVTWASHGEPPRPGVAYIVRSGDALRLKSDRMHVTPQEPHWRGWFNAADTLLTSLTETYGSGAIGIVLSGKMPVGLDGLKAIRRAGGLVIAQNRLSSACFEMPAAACDLAKADMMFAPSGIARALCAVGDQAE
jgi:two-component system chemotaxis response regulator CheB